MRGPTAEAPAFAHKTGCLICGDARSFAQREVDQARGVDKAPPARKRSAAPMASSSAAACEHASTASPSSFSSKYERRCKGSPEMSNVTVCAVLANPHFDERIGVVRVDVGTRAGSRTQGIAYCVFHLQSRELGVAQLLVRAVRANRDLRARRDDVLPTEDRTRPRTSARRRLR